MKIVKFKIVFFYILLILPLCLTAGGNNNTENLTFTVLTIPVNDIPDDLNTESILKIKNPLISQGYHLDDYRPGFDENINFDNCIKKECISDIKDFFPGKVVIIIAITSAEVKIGQKRISRYLVEDITETRYTIYVFTDDPVKEKYDLTFKRTFLDSQKLLKEAEIIGLKIGEFYSSTSIVK